MTKQEKIQEAYGEYWDLVKNNLNKDFSFDFYGVVSDYDFKEKFKIIALGFTGFIAIPFEIIGIDNNNGWIKIESEDDLPKEDCHCWIMDKEKGLQCGQWRQAPNELLHKQAYFYWMKKTTHYQIIIKPQPPIY